MSRTMLLLFLAILALPSFASQPQQNQDPQTAHASQSSNDPQQSAASSSGAQAPSAGGQAHTPPESQLQTQTEGNRRIHDSVSDLLSSDPVLSGAHVEATVDDRNITLTGTVANYAQHQRVLQLVSSYGRWRNIVDKIH